MSLEKMMAIWETRGKIKVQVSTTAEPVPVRLPAWPEAVRALPNGFLRSALFSATRTRKGSRRDMKRERIAAVNDIEIIFTGEQLDQGDRGAYQGLLHIARCQNLGSECRFTAYSMLKLTGKKNSTGNRDTLHERLVRLKATAVEVKQGRFTYIGSLIDGVYKDDVTKQYVVVLNEKLRALFEDSEFTLIDWKIYYELDGRPLAQWLHGFYSSHAKPYPVSVTKLHELCGSNAGLITDFKKDLVNSFENLTQASKIHGQHFEHEILDDLVHVRRVASASQRRHLRRHAVPKSCHNKP